jgi:hypothetical protein
MTLIIAADTFELGIKFEYVLTNNPSLVALVEQISGPLLLDHPLSFTRILEHK